MQTKGVNLLDQAFEQVTDEQIATFHLKSGQQRMGSVLLGSNIRQMGRLQLLVEVMQRVQRMLRELRLLTRDRFWRLRLFFFWKISEPQLLS